MPTTAELYRYYESLRKEIVALKLRPSLPIQTGQAGKVLSTNGYTPTWSVAVVGGSGGGNTTPLDAVPINGSTNGVQSNGVFDALFLKVDKVAGKSLINDTDITKLASIASGATVNSADNFLVNRANHIGTQSSSTISDLQTSISGNSDVVALKGSVGILSSLSTSDKSSLVNAINEVKLVADTAAGGGVIVGDGTVTNAKLATDVKIGSVATLTTTHKSTVIGAINELQAGKANTSHIHNLSTLTQDTNNRLVTDIQIAAWNTKQVAGDYATNTALTNGLAGKAALSHTHAATDITGTKTSAFISDFNTAVDARIPTVESGATIKTKLESLTGTNRLDASAIKNLPTGGTGSAILYSTTGSNTDGAMTQAATTTALQGKASTSHTHTASQISDFSTAVSALIPSNNFPEFDEDLSVPSQPAYTLKDGIITQNLLAPAVVAQLGGGSTSDGRVLAASYCVADGVTNDATGFANALAALAAKWVVGTDEQSADYSAEVFNAVLDLGGKEYLINSTIALPIVSGRTLGGFQIKNGRLKIGDGLKATGAYMFDWTKAEKITFESVTFIGKAGDGLNRNAVRLTSSVGVHFSGCYGIDLATVLKADTSTFDIQISNHCIFRNFTAPFSPVFVDVQGDCMINDSFFIGCDYAIISRLGNNIIRGNHFYDIKSVGSYAINVLSYPSGMIIKDNYMDGCSMRIEGMGYNANITGNAFQNCAQYTAINLVPFNNNAFTSNLVISDNTSIFSETATPVVTNINFSYNAGTGAITINSGVSLSQIHVGGVFQKSVTERLQIYSVTSATAGFARLLGPDYIPSGTYTLSLAPSNLSLSANMTDDVYRSLENILISNNTLAMNGSSGASPIRPVTISTGTSDVTITITDVTTNNVSTTKHGFAPKAPNDVTKYLDGTGLWSAPIINVGINTQTASYVGVLSDNGKLIRMNVATANTFTVPPNSSVAYPIGTQLLVSQTGAGQVTITPGTSVTVNSADGALKTRVQYSTVTLVKTATDTWLLSGDITV